MIDARKQRISDAFGAAADHYDNHAGPQRWAAERVAERAASFGPAHRILEIGCGTGLLTRRIAERWPDAEIIATDVSPAMVATAEQRIGGAVQFKEMDGEWPTAGDAPFDLILSSLTFQWFADLPGAVERSMKLLRPGGRLVFSTMGQRSLSAWRAAHTAFGLESGVPNYPEPEQLRDMLAQSGAVEVVAERVALEQRGALALLRHLRGIGAIVPGARQLPLTRRSLRQVMAQYDRAGGTDDYVVLIGEVTKPAA